MMRNLILASLWLTLAGSLTAPMNTLAEQPVLLSPQDLAERAPGTKSGPYLVDIRMDEEFNSGTVPGAVHGGTDPDLFQPSRPGGDVVLIGPPAEDGAARVDAWSRKLQTLGFRVLLLEGGMEGWRDAGYPVWSPYSDPADVPFVVPRGICEHLPPVQEY